MANFYLKYKSVSEVMKWYLTQESMTCLPASLPSCAYHGGSETDILNFAGNLSLEICKFGQEWSFLLKRAKYSSLVLLLGAGGVVVYMLRSGKKKPPSQDRKPRYQPKSFWSWLFEEELVEDFSADHYFLHSHYFGPSLSFSENLKTVADISGDRVIDLPLEQEDVSLNSLSMKTSPKKFLKRPLYDVRQRGKTYQFLERVATPAHITNPCPKCVKGTCRLKKHHVQQHSSSSSSNYSGSPQNRTYKQSTSTPDDLEDMNPAMLQVFFRQRMDGDGSDEQDASQLTETPVGFLKAQYRPSHRLYSSWRGAPDGKERLSLSPVSRCSSPSNYTDDHSARDDSLEGSDGRFCREESIESDNDVPSLSGCSVSGSMFDLVQNAREVRRLIRAASFTSSCSDLSLDLSANDNLGGNTAEELSALCQGINKLIDNCDNLEDDLAGIPETKLPSSKSSMSGLSQFAEATGMNGADESEMKRDGSIPDLRALQKTLRNNKGMWKLTNFSSLSDREDQMGSRQASIISDSGSFEWDSPLHSWHEARHKRIPLASYSSNVSESGDEVASFSGSGMDPWEWDDCYYIESGEEAVDCPEKMIGHGSWLPDIGTAELDLEAELRRRELSSSSNRSSFERDWLSGRRQPPSGRSSIDRDARLSVSSRGSSASDDVTISAQPNPRQGPDQYRSSRSRSNSRPRDLSPRNIDLKNGAFRMRNISVCSEPGIPECEENPMNTSSSSLDTGIGSMDSSMCSVSSSGLFTSSVNLSPVKEAGEPPTSPMMTSPLSPKSPDTSYPEITIGDISTTNTVIKVVVPEHTSEIRNRTAAKQLFSSRDDHLNDNSVVMNVDKL